MGTSWKIGNPTMCFFSDAQVNKGKDVFPTFISTAPSHQLMVFEQAHIYSYRPFSVDSQYFK